MNEDQRLWRYVDLERLVDLLNRSALYLSRADLLGDPLEGTFPKRTLLERQALVDKTSTLMPFLPAEWQISEYRRAQKDLREWTYITCWHMLEHESVAMWSLYGRDVALRTTYGRLTTGLAGTPIELRQVRYIDFEDDVIDFLNTNTAFVHKRREFAHEHEMRGIWFDQEGFQDLTWHGPFDFPLDPGKWFKVDPNHVIEAIVVAPGMPPWKRDVIEEVCRRFGYQGQILPSSIDREPQL